MAAAERGRLRRWQEHNFYEVIGVEPDATAIEIKKGFRQVALTCHPDKVPEEERQRATKKFQLIAEAYEVLSDATLRRKYDTVRPRLHLQTGLRSALNRRCNNAKAASGPRGMPDFLFGGARCEQCDGCQKRCPFVDMRPCRFCSSLICPHCEFCKKCKSSQCVGGVCERAKTKKEEVSRASQNADPLGREEGSYIRKGPSNAYPDCPQPRGPAASKGPQDTNFAAKQPHCETKSAREASEHQAPAASQVPTASQTPPEPADQPPEGPPLDHLGILLAMGFTEDQAQSAVQRSSSVEAAVEFLMNGGLAPVASAPPKPPPTMDPRQARFGIGAAGQGNNAENAKEEIWRQLTEPLPPRTDLGMVEALFREYSRPHSEAASAQNQNKDMQPQELTTTLLGLGFSIDQATAAVKRCSSLEAAVEWIANRS